MNKFIFKIFILMIFFTNNINAEDNIMILKLKDGDVKIELFSDIAPKHVERIKKLAKEGLYDNVVFHRVIDGFMAQTGDVKFGNSNSPDFNLSLAGTGGSELPNLKAEFTDIAHTRGVLSAARSADPDSANSQFFIMFAPGYFLNGKYTVVGQVTAGMNVVDAIKRGLGPNGAIIGVPDVMQRVVVKQ